ncbi:hypothetical protein PANO111632_02780 [Paracoccus nototheniae]|uniref:Uncharacterized protein n=1 Tax=Paracoccus nototheniae TaxID=2489002 RepID=A0ABW4DZG3_9RHOB|nr:hypothetical protein [Paracoccus nototheniae]
MTAPDRNAADRAMLADFIHHPAQDCDAAARRLAASANPRDREMAAEWNALRSVTCVRL